MRPKDYGTQSYDSQRSGLLNDGFDNSPFTSARGGPDLGDMSTSEIRAKQKQLIEEQDEGFDTLIGVIRRQKEMAKDIGNEVEYQNDLIDEIADHTDATEKRLTQENRRVKKVTKKTGSCVTATVEGNHQAAPEGMWLPSRGIQILCTYKLYGANLHKNNVRNIVRQTEDLSRKHSKALMLIIVLLLVAIIVVAVVPT